jgi:hypothetical protein
MAARDVDDDDFIRYQTEIEERRRFERRRMQFRLLAAAFGIGVTLAATAVAFYRLRSGGDVKGTLPFNWVTFAFLGLGGAGLVTVLMFYLQSSNFEIKRASPFLESSSPFQGELARELSRQSALSERVRYEIDVLKSQLEAVSASKEALTKEQTQSLVENVKKKIEVDASRQFLAEMRKGIRAEARFQDVLLYSRETADRLLREVAALSKRGNLNLSIGIAITVAGLGVLAYVVFQGLQIPREPWAIASHYIPRLSLVLFIELFAYFFLRLYKSSLGEIKYFQNELTNVEAKRLALAVVLSEPDPKILTKVVEDLTRTERNFVLQKGQTTVDLEAARVERDSSSNLLEKLGAIVSKLKLTKD